MGRHWIELGPLSGGLLWIAAGLDWALRFPLRCFLGFDYVAVFNILGMALVLLGLVSLYLRQVAVLSRFWKLPFGLTMIGALLFYLTGSAPVSGASPENNPLLAWFFLGFLALVVGLILSGIATIRAGIYSRWVGALPIAAGILFLFQSGPFETILFGVVWVVLGMVLWRNAGAS